MEILNNQPPSLEWRVYRNDTTKMTLILNDSSGNALDLTDWTFEGDVRQFPKDAEPITSLTITKDENVLTIELDTTDLEAVNYYDIQGTNSETDAISTIVTGQIFIEEDVTRNDA